MTTYPAVHTGPVSEIYAQRHRNHERWGEQSIENRPSGYAGWLPTLGEEFGEVCRALTLEGNLDRLRAELIDTAAVALMWIDSIDREREATATSMPSQELTWADVDRSAGDE